MGMAIAPSQKREEMRRLLIGKKMDHQTRLGVESWHASAAAKRNSRAMMMLKHKPGKPMTREEMEILRRDRTKGRTTWIK